MDFRRVFVTYFEFHLSILVKQNMHYFVLTPCMNSRSTIFVPPFATGTLAQAQHGTPVADGRKDAQAPFVFSLMLFHRCVAIVFWIRVLLLFLRWRLAIVCLHYFLAMVRRKCVLKMFLQLCPGHAFCKDDAQQRFANPRSPHSFTNPRSPNSCKVQEVLTVERVQETLPVAKTN